MAVSVPGNVNLYFALKGIKGGAEAERWAKTTLNAALGMGWTLGDNVNGRFYAQNVGIGPET
jgi:hypothetical protein